MKGHAVYLLAIVMLTAGLAGCAGSENPGTDADGAGSTGPGSGASQDPSDGDDDAGSTEQTEREERLSWEPYRFGEPIVAEGETLGPLSSYSFTLVQEEEGTGAREIRVSVEYVGEQTEEIRSTKHTFDTGEAETEVVTGQIRTHVLVYELELVEDAIDGTDPTTATTRISFPVDDERAQGDRWGATLWAFVKLDVERSEGTSIYEFALDEQSQAEGNNETTFTAYTEGEDLQSWWGFEAFELLFSETFLSDWADNSVALEEGEERGVAGTSWATDAASFEVGGYSFDGRETTWSTEGPPSRSFSTIMSLDLPVPYAIEWDYEPPSDDRQFFTYQLTGLEA